ncbi:uracil-DNA glycosylase [Usitatibacter rugosus]|uniref:uracil-DNA glycosylase n=1 Tax=Usitatibacter rugosus TaxID=2732067 RepID=UPI003CCCD988
MSELAALRIADCFNPYGEQCPIFDVSGAADQRRQILEAIVASAASRGARALWVGRDLGHRGGRRTGLAFTDDLSAPLHTARWGVEFKASTIGPPVSERTATLVWSVLREVDDAVFLWNVFPLHPFVRDQPLSNRGHTSRERGVGEEFLRTLIGLLRPEIVYGIGADASSTLRRVAQCEVVSVRHPSYGGQSLFLRQMEDAYGPLKFASRRAQSSLL